LFFKGDFVSCEAATFEKNISMQSNFMVNSGIMFSWIFNTTVALEFCKENTAHIISAWHCFK